MLDNTKTSYQVIHILFFMTPSPFAHILRDISPNIRTKRVRVIKTVYFENTRHFAFIKHRQKMSGFPMRSVFIFWWGDRKSLLIGNPEFFCLCLMKANCLVFLNNTFYILFTLTLFARISGDSIYYLSKYAKKG